MKPCNHKIYRLEADFADPIWCEQCNINLDIEDLQLSDELIKELIDWNIRYQSSYKLFKKDIDGKKSKHNQQGNELKEKLVKEIREEITVLFKPIQ